MSILFSKRWVAKEWRRGWQWTPSNPARFAADETIFCRILVEIFPLLPENKNSCW